MESVFATIADPTRRRILEVLRTSGPLSVKALADPLPISRQAVTKHLDILNSSGLIQIEKVGRERLHRLDPRSLREVADWLKPYEAFWDNRLERLKHHLDKKTDTRKEES